MNKKVLLVFIIIIAAVALLVGAYTISSLFIINAINDPLPRAAAVVNKMAVSQEYQKLISMNDSIE